MDVHAFRSCVFGDDIDINLFCPKDSERKGSTWFYLEHITLNDVRHALHFHLINRAYVSIQEKP